MRPVRRLHLILLVIVSMLTISSLIHADECSQDLIQDVHLTHDKSFNWASFFSLMTAENYDHHKERYQSAFGYADIVGFTGEYEKDWNTVAKRFGITKQDSINMRDY